MPPEYEEMHKEKLLSHLMDMTMSLRNLCSHQPAAFSREVVITLRMVEQKIPKPPDEHCCTIEFTNLESTSQELNSCVSPKFIYWCPNSQSDDFRRWDLWEVVNFRWGHEGGAFTMELVSLWAQKRVTRGLFLCQVRMQRVLSRNWIFWHLDAGLITSRTLGGIGNRHLFLSEILKRPWDNYWNTHFEDKETEAQRLDDLPNFRQQIVKSQTKDCLTLESMHF